MTTKVSILDRPPTSGSVSEHRFHASGDCTWVLFDPPDAEPWAGVFGKGDVVPYNSACAFADDRSAFVIAGGQGYIVDLSQKVLLHYTKNYCLQAVLAPPDRDFVIAADYSSLLAYDRQGMRWRSEDVALDEIHLDSATASSVTGKVWQLDGWYAFELLLDGWHFTEGRLLSPDWFTFSKTTV